MKILIAALALFTFTAQAKTFTLKRQEARNLMEAMASVSPIYTHTSDSWVPVGHLITQAYGPFVCQWYDGPDKWISSVTCGSGTPGGGIPGVPFNTPYAWFKQIQKFGKDVGTGTMHYYTFNNVSCDFEVATKVYLCTIITP